MGADRWRSRPGNWVIVAAGCAAVVCLVGWPLPTAYAICALTGLLGLVAGVLKLRGELEHRPADDGCGPECDEGHVYAYRCELKPPPTNQQGTAVSRPGSVTPWLIVTAGIGLAVCLTVWPGAVLYRLEILAGGCAMAALVLGVAWAWLGWRAKRRRCGGECAEAHTYTGMCELASVIDASSAVWRLAADGPLTGAGTSSSKGRAGCGGPDCIKRADGAQTGADTDREQGVDASARDHAAELAEQDARRQKEAEAAAAAGDAARRMTCGHTISSVCPRCDLTERTLRAQLAATNFELALAIAHDRQPYPTQAAYTAACAALERHRERADTAEAARKAAEQRARKAEAAAEAWQTSDVIARVRDLAERWERGRAPDFHYARSLYAALNGPVVQADTEQPVSDPQPVDEEAYDICQDVQIGDRTVRIHGQATGELTPEAKAALEALLHVAGQHLDAGHSDDSPAPRRTTSTFRRLATGLTGTVRDEHGNPICTCTADTRCPACLTKGGNS